MPKPEPQLPVNKLISEWCEPKPTLDGLDIRNDLQVSEHGFWVLRRSLHGCMEWFPRHNFREDLNACAEFERLIGASWRDYTQELWVIISCETEYSRRWGESRETDSRVDAQHYAFIRATASDRCAALLKVINAKA